MDEPTSALSREEVTRLFAIIRQLKKRGLTILYISHHLPEIFEIADRVTVLRDGRKIGTRDIGDVTPADLVQMMVGGLVEDYRRRRERERGDVTLQVAGLTRRGFFHDVSFEARGGEILGIVGLSGAGRTELARSLCGLDPVHGGRVALAGARLAPGSYARSVRRGLAYLSEDRKTDGLFLRLSVRENLSCALLPRHGRGAPTSVPATDRVARDLVRDLAITTPSTATEVANLSGGNQQKVLLGKWLATDPAVLVLDEPTRGVDVGAKAKIHEAVLRLADAGRTVILISSDLPELAALADRVLVMRRGHVIGEMRGKALNEEMLLLAANGEGEALDVAAG
jgi:ribose transport system ATP-binding protein